MDIIGSLVVRINHSRASLAIESVTSESFDIIISIS